MTATTYSGCDRRSGAGDKPGGDERRCAAQDHGDGTGSEGFPSRTAQLCRIWSDG